jgi:hypothetical protein
LRVWQVYAGADASFDLVEDDGTSTDYQVPHLTVSSPYLHRIFTLL